MKALYIDYGTCIGCDFCAQRCSLEKTGKVKPAQSRIHIVKVEAAGTMIPAACRHCDDPLCLPACPENCISKDAVTGLVSIDEPACIGCMKCVWACPYAGPVKLPSATAKMKNVKVFCDLCGGDPKCVGVCPTGTLQYTELDAAMKIHKDQGEAELAVLLEIISPTVITDKHRH